MESEVYLNQIKDTWQNLKLTLTSNDLSRIMATDFVSVISVDCELNIKKHSLEQLNLKAAISSSYVRNCDVCLQDIPKKFSGKFELSILPASEYRKLDGEIKQLKLEDECDIDFYTSQKIDLIKYIEDYLLLEILDYCKCQDNCKGLCENCGINLNLSSCDCSNI